MKKLLRAFLLLVSCSMLCAQMDESTSVMKKAEGNPSLSLCRFSGTAGERQELERALQLCGWFQMTASGQNNGEIQLQAQVIRTENSGFRISGQVQGNGKFFSINQSGNELRMTVFAFVDQLLQGLYGVPGLASRPIVYVLADAKGKKELFSCLFDGSSQRRITQNNGISTEPKFGPPGMLTYTLLKNHSISVALLDQNNHRQRIVSHAKGLNAVARLSRNGKKIALPMSLDGMIDLYLLDLERNARIRLTKDKNVESSPVWSPDGTKLLFVSNRYGVPQLFQLDLSDYSVKKLSVAGREAVSPDWSPVSNLLCYSTRQNGNYVIAVQDMSHPQEPARIVTSNTESWESPSWAPDGRHVICTKGPASGISRDLYIVDTWLGTTRQISRGAKVSLPVWSP